MGNKIMQETTPLVECSAFHRGMSVLEASLRNTEDSETIISGLLKGAAEFYGASRASVVEADWDLGIGVITYEWCKDGVSAQRDMLQCLPMEKFPRWRKALRANKPVVISDLQRLENVYPDEAAFFREYGVTTLLAAPFSKRINQGFIAVDDPTRYTDDPVFRVNPKFCVNAKLRCKIEQKCFKAGAAQAAAAFSTKITALRGDVKGGGVSLRSSRLLTFRLQPVSPACGRQRTPLTVRELRSSPAAFRSTSS